MGLDQDSIMIIHMGGTYGDKEATLQRFEENYLKLPQSIKNRLVLENDEMCYSVADLLPVCQKLDIPLVLDWHHHSINTGGIENVESLLPAIAETWSRKGIKPKQHYSESRKGAVTPMERRAHSDRVVRIPPCEEDMDLMIEAKDKEQAVLQLYRDYKLYEISDDVLREPGEETKQTKGRKSSKKTKIEERDIISTDAEGVKIRKRQQRKVDVEKEIADEFIELPTDNVDEQHDIIPKKRLSRKIKSVTMETTNIPIPAVDEKIESNDSIEKGESTNSKKPKGRPRKRPGKVVKTNNIENSPVITSSTENMPNFEVALPKPVKHSRRVSKPGAPSPDIAHPLTNAVPARQRSVRQK
ncbi:hypothetical protein BZG36_01052 [Bifiguratus adelaidae]|uniref:UV-damage endonuclease n=1 Tax=Bifiguratus adelaidae TaxID=1938954 RepID=A0A261Y686_9FUNG|nr:hypothetical protein BZG36_01052 [Bifiguratus adelaidae]